MMMGPAALPRQGIAVSKAALILLWFALLNVLMLVTAQVTVLGDLALVATLAALVYWRPGILIPDRQLRWVWLAFLAYGGVFAVSTALHPEFQAVKHTVGVGVGATLFFHFAYNAPRFFLRRDAVLVVIGAVSTITVLGLAADVAAKNVISAMLSYYGMIAGLLAVGTAASPAAGLRAGLITFAAVMVIGLTLDHRTMMGLGAAGGLFWLMLNLAPVRLFRWGALAVALLGIGLLLVLNTDNNIIDTTRLSELIHDYTGRSAASGRQNVWPQLLALAVQKPIFGWGAGVVISEQAQVQYSAHNFYLQIYLQIGLVGLATLIALLLSMWQVTRMSGAPGSRQIELYMTAVLMIVIVHSALSDFLTQNLLVVAVPVWILLGLGLGQLAHLRRPPQ